MASPTVACVPALVEFITANPNVAVEIDEHAGIADLMGDRLDFSIRIERDPEPGLIARRLGVSRFVVVAAPAYLEHAGAPRHPRDLGQHRLVGFSPIVWGNDWRFRGPEGAVDVPVRPTLVCKVRRRCARRRSPGSGSPQLRTGR